MTTSREPHARLPRADLPGWRRTLRYYIARSITWLVMRLLFRVRVVGRDRLPAGPAVYCFNHLNWIDPFLLMATLPFRPRLFFFGPKEEDMGVGSKNRLIGWTATAVPFKPGRNDLLETTRRVQAVFDVGGVLAIAGEGRIHVHESDLLPLQEGSAYFALRGGVPVVPVALTGCSWLGFRRRLTVTIGPPIPVEGRPSREAIEVLTVRVWVALHALIADAPELAVPGRFGRWLTELFNDWPEGSRAAAAEVRGPSGILPDDPAAPSPVGE